MKALINSVQIVRRRSVPDRMSSVIASQEGLRVHDLKMELADATALLVISVPDFGS